MKSIDIYLGIESIEIIFISQKNILITKRLYDSYIENYSNKFIEIRMTKMDFNLIYYL